MLFYKIIWHVNCYFKKIFFKIIFGNKIKFGRNVQFRKRFNLAIDKGGKVIIGNNTFFNNDCSINAMNQVTIGDNCLFGENVKIYDHNHKFRDISKLIGEQGYSVGEIFVGNNCWICSNVTLLKNTNIKDNAVISAGSIINQEIEKNILVKMEKSLEKLKICEKNENNEKIKVMHVFHSMDVGGAQTLIMNIYRNIDLNKYEFSFIVSKKGFFDEEIRKKGGKIYIIPYVTKTGSIVYKNKIKEIFKENPDYKIVHSHIDQVSGIVMQAAKEAGINGRISHSHNTQNVNGFFGNLYKKYLESKILPNATDLLACSQNAAEWLFKEKSKDAIVINNGIDIEKFKYSEEKRKKIRKELNISEDTFVIGHIGVFRKQKNHEFLIKIFYKYLKQNTKSVLILVGDGELKDNIENQVKELNIQDKVKFLGVRLDNDYIYSAMDLFLFPSYFEGLSLSLIEAQISGLTILTSMGVDKKTNISGNIKFIHLSDSIEKWIEQIKKYDRYDGRKVAIGNGYDLKETVDKVLKIYEKINKKG